MKPYRAICLICLLLAAVPAQAQDQTLERVSVDVIKIATQEQLTDMMSVSMRLKEAGASYQKALTYPEIKLDDSEAMRVFIGVRQFDALYAAAFGKKKDVAAFLKAQNDQVMQLNLKGRVDVAAVFPPELNWMLREPDKVNFKDIVAAYADNLSRYEKLGEEPAGLDVIGDALFGFVVEGLYVTGQSILQAGSDPQMLRVINGMSPSLNALSRLYEAMTHDKQYAAFCDTAEALELGERRGWIKEMADMLAQKGGSLSGNELQAIATFAVKKRQTLVPED